MTNIPNIDPVRVTELPEHHERTERGDVTAYAFVVDRADGLHGVVVKISAVEAVHSRAARIDETLTQVAGRLAEVSGRRLLINDASAQGESTIKPALSGDEWEDVAAFYVEVAHHDSRRVRPAAAIAVSNARLTSGDQRKITHSKLDALRVILWNWEGERSGAAADQLAFLDALESYLPPRGASAKPLHPRTHPGLTPELERNLNDRL